MVCSKLTHLKKYNIRPSPPFPANNIDCHFRTFVGNDGYLWSSQPNASGIFNWIRVLRKQTKSQSTLQKKKSLKKSSLTKSKLKPKKSSLTKSKLKPKKSKLKSTKSSLTKSKLKSTNSKLKSTQSKLKSKRNL